MRGGNIPHLSMTREEFEKELIELLGEPHYKSKDANLWRWTSPSEHYNFTIEYMDVEKPYYHMLLGKTDENQHAVYGFATREEIVGKASRARGELER